MTITAHVPNSSFHEAVHQRRRPSTGRLRPLLLGRFDPQHVDLSGTTISRAVTLRHLLSYVTREIFAQAGMTGAGFFDRRDTVPRVAEGWDLVDDRRRSKHVQLSADRFA